MCVFVCLFILTKSGKKKETKKGKKQREGESQKARKIALGKHVYLYLRGRVSSLPSLVYTVPLATHICPRQTDITSPLVFGRHPGKHLGSYRSSNISTSRDSEERRGSSRYCGSREKNMETMAHPTLKALFGSALLFIGSVQCSSLVSVC